MQSPSGLTSHMAAPKTLQATGSCFSPALTCIRQAGLQFADRVAVSCGWKLSLDFAFLSSGMRCGNLPEQPQQKCTLLPCGSKYLIK